MFENNFFWKNPMESSANLNVIDIKILTVLILVIYCLFHYLVLANNLSAILCPNLAKKAVRGYRGPLGKKGKCR